MVLPVSVISLTFLLKLNVYDQLYVFSCLSKDISDYQQFVKEHIERTKFISFFSKYNSSFNWWNL